VSVAIEAMEKNRIGALLPSRSGDLKKLRHPRPRAAHVIGTILKPQDRLRRVFSHGNREARWVSM
jgi:hypothetical protein